MWYSSLASMSETIPWFKEDMSQRPLGPKYRYTFSTTCGKALRGIGSTRFRFFTLILPVSRSSYEK
jgi:hypothetical protein